MRKTDRVGRGCLLCVLRDDSEISCQVPKVFKLFANVWVLPRELKVFGPSNIVYVCLIIRSFVFLVLRRMLSSVSPKSGRVPLRLP